MEKITINQERISISDQRKDIVNNFLKGLNDIVGSEQKDLRNHRKYGMIGLAIFLGMTTIAVFVLLFIMIIEDKGTQTVQLALIAAVFADTLGLVYIVFKYLFADSHRLFEFYKEIVSLYEENENNNDE